MSVLEAQRSLCTALPRNVGLKKATVARGNEAAANLTCPQRKCNGSGFTAPTSGPVGSSRGEKKCNNARDSSTNAALTGHPPPPSTTSLYSGHSARPIPLGFLLLLIYTSLQASFTVRTVQLYFQAH